MTLLTDQSLLTQDAQVHNETLSQIVGLRYTPISNIIDTTALSIDEVCKLNNWLIENPNISGIFNIAPTELISLKKLQEVGYNVI